MRASVKWLFMVSLSLTVVMCTAIAFVKVNPSSNTAPQKSDSRSNLQQLGQALRVYTHDYNYVFPPMKNLASIGPLLAPYLQNKTAFINPDTKQPFLLNSSLSSRDLFSVYKESYQKKQSIVALYEATSRADGSRYAVALPMPDGLNEKGEPLWKGQRIKIVDATTGTYSLISPDFKIISISNRDWGKVKKASGIR
jgi:hypothetical protein